MKISKNGIVFFMVVSALLLIVRCAIYLFADPYSRGGQNSFDIIFTTLQVVLTYIIYGGIFWVLKKLNEKKWIAFGFAAWSVFQLGVFLYAFVMPLLHAFSLIPGMLIFSIDILIISYLVLAFAFIRNKIIKMWLILYAIALCFTFVVPQLTAMIYDNFFQFNWLLTIPAFLTNLTPVIPVMLFFRLYQELVRNNGEIVENYEGRPFIESEY